MKITLVAGAGRVCSDCSVRQFNVCAALDTFELRELEQLGRHAGFTPGETVFAQEELMTSVYKVLEGIPTSSRRKPKSLSRSIPEP